MTATLESPTVETEAVDIADSTTPDVPARDFKWAVEYLGGFKHPSLAGFWDTVTSAVTTMEESQEILRKANVSAAAIGEYIQNATEGPVFDGWKKLQDLRAQANELEAALTAEVKAAISPDVSEEQKDATKAEFQDARKDVLAFAEVATRLVVPKLDKWAGENTKKQDMIPDVKEAFELLSSQLPTLKGIGGGSNASANGTTKAKNPDAPKVRKWLKEVKYADGSKVINDRGRLDEDDVAKYYEEKAANRIDAAYL